MSTSIETPLETKMQVRACLAATYRRRGSWEAVADYYGKFSKAAYWRTAKEPGYLPPPGLMENVLAKGAAPRLQSIPIYPDADVDVYYRSGNGSLHTYTVPADAEVVIVPAGARVVQSKPASKPRRKRTTRDLSRLERRGWSTAEIDRALNAMYDYPDDMRNLLRLLSALPGEPDPVRLITLVDGWLAEDAATDPGEGAGVLARLE